MPISDSIQAEMEKVNALFGEAVVKGRNFAALDEIYTVDARILPPGADLIEGRENIKGFWQAAVAGDERTGCEACRGQRSPCRRQHH
jgi:ketosteroid isomerase-like protein